jgi:hypothetical protein
MNIHGNLFRVTDLPNFAHGILSTGKPPQNTFDPFPGARVQVTIDSSKPTEDDLPTGLRVTFETKTNASGAFSIAPQFFSSLKIKLSDGGSLDASGWQAHITAFRLEKFSLPLQFEVPRPIYRSGVFHLKNVGATPVSIFIARVPASMQVGITQDEVTAEVATFKKKLGNAQKLTAIIGDGRIGVGASAAGADIRFGVVLIPGTTANATAFLKFQLEDFDVDLPGPDAFAEMCVNKDDIENFVRKRLKSLLATLNEHISSDLESNVVPPAVARQVGFTIEQLHYPLVKHGTIGGLPIDIRMIMPDIAVGWPHKLYG